jgi:hypothetical protein
MKSSAAVSMPPVPHAGSSTVFTMPGVVTSGSSGASSRFTMSLMTSRGVKCSPAVSFEIPENRRINSSKA